MNWSAVLVAEDPDWFVTVTSTVPEPVGLTAISTELETNVGATVVAPNATVLSLVKPLPAIVTWVPPAVGPTVGAIAVTVGAAAWASAGHMPTIRTVKLPANTSFADRPSRRVRTVGLTRITPSVVAGLCRFGCNGEIQPNASPTSPRRPRTTSRSPTSV